MARRSLVAVSYPADDEFAQINTGVLRGLAEVVFLDGRSDDEFRKTLRRADVLIGWHLSQELSAGVWQDSPGLRLVQLLSAGADSVDFAAIPERAMVAANAGAYSEPMAEYVMAVALALARRLPVVVEYWAAGLTWGYGTDMIGTRVCRAGLPAAGDRAVLARAAGALLGG